MDYLVSKSRRTLKFESVKGATGVQDIFCNLTQLNWQNTWVSEGINQHRIPCFQHHIQNPCPLTPYNAAEAPPTSTGTAIFVVFEAVSISLFIIFKAEFYVWSSMGCNAMWCLEIKNIKKKKGTAPWPHLCGITSNMNFVSLKGLLEMNMI
ncbi:hypothetical protein NC652_029244 [Populus alba x Populus x berolinensis]|nr:hypothetical protein NC652_029244 [Populus alba x Populus x berolinensis]